MQDPLAHWDVISLPLAPAPLEAPSTPLWNEDIVISNHHIPWSYPTEVQFVAYAAPSPRSIWVAAALAKYRIHLISQFDVPYTLVARAPLTIP